MSLSRVLLVFVGVVLCVGDATSSPISTGGAAPPDRQIELEEKPLPPGAIARLGSLLLRHEQEVRSIAFSPDGKKIASVAKYEPTIRVWDAVSGKLLHEFDATGIFSRGFHDAEDFTIAFTPDGQSIAAGVGADVCFWDLQSGKEIRRFLGKGTGILALTFSRDNKTFYCGGSDNKLYHWDIPTGKQIHCWDYFEASRLRIKAGGSAEKTAILKAICPDGKTAVWLVRGSNGAGEHIAQITLWDATTGKDRCQITSEDDKDSFVGENVVLSPNGKFLTAFTRNSEMIVWDAATGKKLKTLGDGGSIEAVAYSPDGRRVAAISRIAGPSLIIWDLATGKELWHHEICCWYAPGWDKSLIFAPDGKTVALSHWKSIRIWNVETAKEVPLLDGHRWPVRTLAFSPRDGDLISADDASVCQWNSGHRQASRFPLIVYHGGTRSTAESYETKLRIFQPDSRPPQLRQLFSDKILYEFNEIKGGYSHGCFSTDGHTVALLRRDGKNEVIFLDVPTRKVRSCFTSNELISEDDPVLSRDGKMLAAICSDQTVVLVDSYKGAIVRRLGTPRPAPGENEPKITLTHGTFSPNGQLVAFGTRVDRPGNRFGFGNRDDSPPAEPGIRVWNVATGRELRQFDNCMATVLDRNIASLQFSPDNKGLGVALLVGMRQVGDLEPFVVPVLEVASGRPRKRFKGHSDQVRSVAFSHDGKRLVTGSEDSTILLWDMNRRSGDEPAAKLPAAERLNLYWSNLAEQDATCAYDAILALAEMPGQSVPFLTEKLKPAESPSNEQLAKLIADLDNDSFKVRQEASGKLLALHETARPALERALSGKVSPEVHRRIAEIVEQLDTMKYPPDLMRQLRSVEVLERITSPEARSLLETLAGGAAEATLTREAKASLARLKPAR